jgi:hypothetical protein
MISSQVRMGILGKIRHLDYDTVSLFNHVHK